MTKNNLLTAEGGTPLQGEVELSGAKNAATKMMVASLLTDQKCVLENYPDLGDTNLIIELIETIGGQITVGNKEITIFTPVIKNFLVEELSQRNRIPILAIAPLLHRIGKAEVPIVGGDLIGPRPVNFHIDALKKFGATIYQKENSLYAEAEKLRGAAITLPYPSVGATETFIFAAVLADGLSILENAAVEPEIIDLISFLKKMGALISVAGRAIKIEGVKKLRGAQYKIMPDRNEAVSFACLALATGGEIFVKGAEAQNLSSFLNMLDLIGGKYEIQKHGIRFIAGAVPFKPVRLETNVHPGFMTDWQPPFAVLLTKADGVSTIHETVYEERLNYTEILKKMGAKITTSTACLGSLPCRFSFRGYHHSATIKGPTSFYAKDFNIPDIRAGFTAIIAALASKGVSRISGIHHIERGYENLWEKIKKLGAKIALS